MRLEDAQIIKPAISETTRKLNELIQKQQQLKSAAIKFLQNINKIIEIYENIQQHELKLFKAHGMTLSNFYEKMNESNEILQNVIKQQYIFQQALNKFLNREIILLFVDDNGRFLYGDELEIYNYVSKESKSQGRGAISFGKMRQQQKMIQFPKEISKQFEDEYKKRLEQHKGIYDKTKERLRQNLMGGTSNMTSYMKQYLRKHKLFSTFWWANDLTAKALNERYGWSRSGTNFGHLGQAYASLVWQNEHQRIFDPLKESDIRDFFLYMVSNGVYDNVSGLIKGDVSFLAQNFLNTAVQFAVKSTGAYTGRIGDYLVFASLLTSEGFVISEKSVNQTLNNLQSYGQSVRQRGLEVTIEKINSIINQINKKI